MAKSIRSNPLETRTNRLKLPVAWKPTFVKIGAGLSLGYRRNQTAGTWVLRIADGKGGSSTRAIGHADDFSDADGQNFLTFFQAQNTARRLAEQPIAVKPLTVGEATANYLVVLETRNKRTAYDTKLRLEKHFLPHFGDKLISSLTKTMLEKWLAGLVVRSNNPEDVRRSKDSANRVLTMVKAVLNHAVQDQSHGIKDDNAWRWVKSFKSVGQPRSVRYTIAEVEKLIHNAPNQGIKDLIEGAYLTGTRLGEMANALISSVDLPSGNWTVSGKTGSRTIMLQSAAVSFFERLIGDRAPSDFLFTKENGEQWKASEHTRLVAKALENAGLSADGNLYAMRHTYISMALENNTPLNIVEENCGTSVRMITKTYAKVLAEKKRAFIESGAPKPLSREGP
jgi:integrase